MPNSDILDLGCGCGDSTALLSAETNPHTLQGITSHASQSNLSRQRFPNIQFIHADAVEYLASLPSDSIDRLFALDCVYHFPSSRLKFLQQSARVLRNNEKIALTDLIFGDNVTAIQRLFMRVVCFLSFAPYSNFRQKTDYYDDFVQAGFQDVSIQDISENVFPGLRDFIYRHRREMDMFEIGGKWMGYLLFAAILKWWLETGVVRFVVVHARKSYTSTTEEYVISST